MLLINLIAAHAKRFHWAWRKLGIHLTHAGLIIMLAGGLFTDLFAVESHMRLSFFFKKDYSEDLRSDASPSSTRPTRNSIKLPRFPKRSCDEAERTIEHESLGSFELLSGISS